MGRHGHGQIGKRPEGGKIRCVERRSVGIDRGQRMMAVDRRPPVTGDVLDDRRDTGRHQPVRSRARQRRDRAGVGAKGPVADDAVRLRKAQIGDRKTIDIDPAQGKVGSDQVPREPRGTKAVVAAARVDRADRLAGWVAGP